MEYSKKEHTTDAYKCDKSQRNYAKRKKANPKRPHTIMIPFM